MSFKGNLSIEKSLKKAKNKIDKALRTYNGVVYKSREETASVIKDKELFDKFVAGKKLFVSAEYNNALVELQRISFSSDEYKNKADDFLAAIRDKQVAWVEAYDYKNYQSVVQGKYLANNRVLFGVLKELKQMGFASERHRSNYIDMLKKEIAYKNPSTILQRIYSFFFVCKNNTFISQNNVPGRVQNNISYGKRSFFRFSNYDGNLQ